MDTDCLSDHKEGPGVPLVEFVYLVFTYLPGDSYSGRLGSLLLCVCDVFQALMNKLPCLLILQRLSEPCSVSDYSVCACS